MTQATPHIPIGPWHGLHLPTMPVSDDDRNKPGHDRRRALACLAALPALCVAGTSAAARSVQQAGAIVNVRDFGARGDGQAIDSPAINRAIDHAAARGGGTIWFPAGTYLSYSIRLKSHIRLFLDAGCTIIAADTPREGMANGGYDAAPDLPEAIVKFQDHGHSHWRNALIWGEGLEDIAIEGPGLLWGKGLGRGHPEDADKPLSGKPGVGDKLIALKLCRNILLRDFRVLEGGWFALLATGCDNMTIDNLLVDTNRDGFDIDCCRNVRISNCTVNAPWDDAICPKSSFALGYARPTENVTISDCTVSGSYIVGSVLEGSYRRFNPAPQASHGRIKLGTESNGGFRNITIINCVFDTCRGLALETVDGAFLEDITVSNLTMRNLTTSPLFLRLGARMRGPAGATPGTFRRISIQNIVVSGADRLPSIIAGIPGHAVEDVRITDMFVEQAGGADAVIMRHVDPPEAENRYPEPTMFGLLPATGFFVRHARNLMMANIEVRTLAPDPRPAFLMRDVDRFDGVNLTMPADADAFLLADVRNFAVRASRSVADFSGAGPLNRSISSVGLNAAAPSANGGRR